MSDMMGLVPPWLAAVLAVLVFLVWLYVAKEIGSPIDDPGSLH